MATISFTIPDEHLTDAVNGLARHFGYRAILEDGSDNPETKAVYAKRKIAATIKASAKRGLMQIQQDELTAVTDIDVTPQ